jgi:WD40 repeat protein/transcriptional regulator with XRE-family HTH domain
MKHPLYGEPDYAFGQLMLTLRTRMGLTQVNLAHRLGISRRAVSTWELGSNYPKAEHLKELIALAVQQRVWEAGSEAEEIRSLWRAAHQKVLLDERWLQELLGKEPPRLALVARPSEEQTTVVELAAPGPRVEWGDALDVPSFYGREQELATLAQWVVDERCRVVSVLGLGGIGKSALAVTLMHRVATHFEVVIWRSLRDAPSCDALLDECLQVLAPQPLREMPDSLEGCLYLLMEQMRERRVLLVLDDLEMLLEEGESTGRMRAGSQGYARLLQRMGETRHQSCLLLTSREKPVDLVPLEGSRSPVRALRLAGLDTEAGAQLLAEKDVVGSPHELARLVEVYRGNPLALKIVAQTIVDLFGGEIIPFLEQGEVVFGGVRELLREQFDRLSALEQTVFSWLAILREPASLEELLSVLSTPRARVQVLEALDGLRRRSLIERGQRPGSFTLQSVVLEYATARLIAEASSEIEQGHLDRLNEYGFCQAQAKDYVRQAQEHLLVVPLLIRLQSTYQGQADVEERFLWLLDHLRGKAQTSQGYGPANLVALLRLLRGDLRSLDLSGLSIRGAYLQGVQMQDTRLSGSHLHEVVWTSPFDAVLSIAVSPDGRFWAAGSNSGEVRVWREGGRVAHAVLRANTDRIGGIAFSPDGRTLVTASWDSTIQLWDLASGTALRALREHDKAVTSIVFRPDGWLLASSSYDGTVRIWDARDGTCLRILQAHSGPVLTLAWSPDGRLLASAGFDQTIRLWDTEQGTLLRELRGHLGYVTGLAFAPGASTLASSSFDATIRLWEVETGTYLRTFTGHTGAVSAVAWSPSGRMVASCGYDTTIRLWDQDSEQCRSVLRGHNNLVLSLAFTPDGQRLLSGSHDQTLRVWESESGRCVRIMQGYAVSLFAVAWSPDGNYLVDGSSDAVLTLWLPAPRAGFPQDQTPVQVLRGHTQCINDVAWSRVGGMLASSSDDQTVRVWDVRTGACLRILRGHTNLVNGIAWHPDGNLLASSSTDRAIRVWDVREGASRWTGTQHTGTVTSVAWHPNGNLLASSSEDHCVLVWHAERGEVLLRLDGHEGPVYDVAWSPDGSRLASCGGSGRRGELLVWDAVGGDSVASYGKRIRALEADMSPVFSLAWSLDGTLLVSGGTDGVLRWWDIERDSSPAVVQGHEGWVHSIRASPDGATVASSGEDGAIQLWDLHSRRHLGTLRRDRPYERLNISGVKGVTEAQKTTLRALGAIEEAAPSLTE